MSTNTNASAPSRSLLIAAFIALYTVWGSTYLAIRVAVESLPPFLMAGARFVIAGALLYLFMRLRGDARPTLQHWKNSFISGTLLLLGGNGLVVWAEQYVTSGLAALIIAIVPLWIALLDWARPQGERPSGKNILGIAIGFAGVILLVMGQGKDVHGAGVHVGGIIALVFACILWAWGSLFMKHNARPTSPLLGVGMQMLCGGATQLLVGLMRGEMAQTDFSAFTNRSLIAFVYLVVVGSWIGFSAYIWLLQVCNPSLVATYAYVNPIVAVFLGWWLLDEHLNGQTIMAAAVIVVGVCVITLPKNFGEMVNRGIRRLRGNWG
ncbi:MAG TPA: drug/metabolite exporter YedA [Verrucomicrobiae bacterium]